MAKPRPQRERVAYTGDGYRVRVDDWVWHKLEQTEKHQVQIKAITGMGRGLRLHLSDGSEVPRGLVFKDHPYWAKEN